MEAGQTELEAIGRRSVLRRTVSIVLRFCAGSAILFFILRLVDWRAVLAAFESANPWYIFAAAILTMVHIGIRTLKWRSMLGAVKQHPTLLESFGSVMLGIALGSLTPGEVGDYAGRILHVTDARRSHLLGLAVLDKAQVFVVISVFGAVSICFLLLGNSLPFVLAALAIAGTSAFLMMEMNRISSLGHKVNARFLKRTMITQVLNGFNLLNLRQTLRSWGYTVGIQAIVILQMHCLLNAFDVVPLGESFVGTSAMMSAKSFVPISIGDLGVREAGAMYFFSLFHVSRVASLNASLLLFFLNILIPGVIGAFFIRNKSFSLAFLLRSMKRENGAPSHD